MSDREEIIAACLDEVAASLRDGRGAPGLVDGPATVKALEERAEFFRTKSPSPPPGGTIELYRWVRGGITDEGSVPSHYERDTAAEAVMDWVRAIKVRWLEKSEISTTEIMELVNAYLPLDTRIGDSDGR